MLCPREELYVDLGLDGQKTNIKFLMFHSTIKGKEQMNLFRL